MKFIGWDPECTRGRPGLQDRWRRPAYFAIQLVTQIKETDRRSASVLIQFYFLNWIATSPQVRIVDRDPIKYFTATCVPQPVLIWFRRRKKHLNLYCVLFLIACRVVCTTYFLHVFLAIQSWLYRLITFQQSDESLTCECSYVALANLAVT